MPLEVICFVDPSKKKDKLLLEVFQFECSASSSAIIPPYMMSACAEKFSCRVNICSCCSYPSVRICFWAELFWWAGSEFTVQTWLMFWRAWETSLWCAVVYFELKLFDAFWNMTVQSNQSPESIILSLSTVKYCKNPFGWYFYCIFSVTEVLQNIIFLLICIFNQCQNSSEKIPSKLSNLGVLKLFYCEYYISQKNVLVTK